jgi:hypothetical protein
VTRFLHDCFSVQVFAEKVGGVCDLKWYSRGTEENELVITITKRTLYNDPTIWKLHKVCCGMRT